MSCHVVILELAACSWIHADRIAYMKRTTNETVLSRPSCNASEMFCKSLEGPPRSSGAWTMTFIVADI